MTTAFAFEEWPKIPRLKARQVITEKIDGSNGQIALFPLASEEVLASAKADPFCLAVLPGNAVGDSALALYAGSRSRWLGTSSISDNFGFAKWVRDNADDLLKLGEGRHFGEWWGFGIQRRYGINEKRFSLFNTARWNPENPNKPACCHVVPIVPCDEPDAAMAHLAEHGSLAVPGWDKPEGIVVYHSASRSLYKRTFDDDAGKYARAK